MATRVDTAPAQTAAVDGPPPDPRRWRALIFIALAQLMVALDATIVNIALPSAQSALGITDGDRQWVITAYTLAFGGLLLLGGRIADVIGRKRTFLIGLVGFAAASALGGAAANVEMLIGARALQGAFGALLAPSALALLTVTFTRPKERAKAFAIYGAIAGSGAAVGMILGGALAEYLDWRACLYVNVPIALVTFVGASALLTAGTVAGRPRLDIPGAVLATSGLVAVVYGCSEAASRGWDSGTVIGLLAAGVALLIAFVVVETRVASPLLPMRVLLDRTRGGSYLAVALVIVGMFGLFLFMTYYLQVVLAFSPLQAGLAFLPMSAAVMVSAGAIASKLQPRVPPRALMVPGLLVAAAGMVWLTQLTADSGYVTGVLPAEILLGLGMGCVFVPAMSNATAGVDRRDAGVASAVVNAAQQVGGSIGVALLNTIATTATAGYLATRRPDPRTITDGLVYGSSVAAWVAAGILVVAAVLTAVLINAGKPAPHQGAAR